MYQYEPLDRSQRASRLVVLQPGNKDDEIECSMISPLLLESFELLLKYEALSYVWGDSTDTKDIQLEGCPFPVGKNLYSALLHLRHEDKIRLLWIDAICINQDDVLERNWQVSHMGLIYRSAKQVLVWLGESTFESRNVFALLLVFEHIEEGRGAQVRPELRNFAACVFGDLEKSPDFTDMEGYEVIFRYFDELVQGPLFQRAWIVQEIVLAQKVMVHCGFHYATWDILVEGYVRASHIQRICCGVSDAQNASRNFMQIATLRKGLRIPESDDYQNLTLMRLAARFGRLEATNPRDRLYACLGISRQLIETGKLVDHGFYPDYNKPMFQVYKEFALFCIQKYQTLEVFSAGQALDPDQDYHRRLEEWPSWVPDWQLRGMKTWGFKSLVGPVYNLSRDFHASGDTTPVVEELPGVENILSVEGILFDTVLAVTDEWFEDPKAISSWDMKWLKWHAFYEQEPPNGNPYGSEDARQEAYWRTLVADSNGEGGNAPEEFGDCFKIWRYFKSNYGRQPGRISESWIPEFDFAEVEEDLPDIAKTYDAFIDQMFMAVRGRKLFKTRRGYIGIGSWAVEPGWTVCILHGGNFPVLAQTAGYLSITPPEESTAQPNSQSEGIPDAETLNIEKLSLIGDTISVHYANFISDEKLGQKKEEDAASLEEIDGPDKGRTGKNEMVKGNGETEADISVENTIPEVTKVAHGSFFGPADCYIHGIMDGEALDIAKAEGLIACRTLFG